MPIYAILLDVLNTPADNFNCSWIDYEDWHNLRAKYDHEGVRAHYSRSFYRRIDEEPKDLLYQGQSTSGAIVQLVEL
jgi:hypothetical protein